MKSRAPATFALVLAMACSSERTDRTDRPARDDRPDRETKAAEPRHAQPGPTARWDGLAALLPHPEIGGWRAASEGPRLYPADELYTYMDGQCDSYLEYGVRMLAVADYHPASGAASRTVQIELYDMGSPGGAFGRWSRLAVEGGDPAEMLARFVDLGAGGVASGTDLAFWKAQHLVKLTFLDESPDATEASLRSAARDVLLPIARTLATALPGDAGALPELSRLPADGRLPHSEVRYGRATLGLEELGAGLSAEYAIDGKRMRLFVVERTTPAEATAAFDAVRGRLTGPVPVPGLGDAALQGTDPDRGELLVTRQGAWVVVVANSDTPDVPAATAEQKKALAQAAL